MRTALLTAALISLAVPVGAQAHGYRRLATRHGHVRHYAYHIPRFDQGEAEAYVHTVYPYRTGLYVPWPDAYGAPYPYPY